MDLEDRVLKLEKDNAMMQSTIKNVVEDVKEVKSDVKGMKEVNTNFLIELNRFGDALKQNTKSVEKLTTQMESQIKKPLITIDKIKIALITFFVTTGIGGAILFLIKKLIINSLK